MVSVSQDWITVDINGSVRNHADIVSNLLQSNELNGCDSVSKFTKKVMC